MCLKREHKNFWDRNAGRYDRFMRKDRAAYEKMYELIRPVVKAKTVLELATGTGSIAKHIVNAAAHIEATDAAPEMIAEAKRDTRSAKLHFSVQDMFRLPYADKSFDVVIVSNALHIVPQPEKALQEIKRVLKDGGVLIAPTFTHAGNSFSGKVKAFFMKLAGSLIVFIVGIPLITMRSFSEERKNKTDQLLLTAPVSLWKVVLGKYLAMITVIGIPSVIFCIYPLIIKSQGTAYLGVDYISILVFFLLGCVFAAIGMFLSSLTESQIIAFISTFGILLVLYLWNGILTLLPSSAVSGLVGVLVILTIVAFYIFHMTSNLMLAGGLEVIGVAAAVIAYFVKSSLFENLLSKMFGRLALSDVFTDITSNSIVDVTGIALYLSLIAVFVFLTVQSIQKRRWS